MNTVSEVLLADGNVMQHRAAIFNQLLEELAIIACPSDDLLAEVIRSAKIRPMILKALGDHAESLKTLLDEKVVVLFGNSVSNGIFSRCSNDYLYDLYLKVMLGMADGLQISDDFRERYDQRVRQRAMQLSHWRQLFFAYLNGVTTPVPSTVAAS